jgi:hypothetical protein
MENIYDRSSPSDKQLNCLERFGFDINKPLDRAEAWHLINDLVNNQRQLPPTQKQELFLRKRGHWRDGLTRGEACDLIGMLVQEDQGR